MVTVYRYAESQKPYKHVLLKRRYGQETNERDYENMKQYDERLACSLSRSRRLFRDIAYCNYLPVFATFTMAADKVGDRYDFKELKKRLMKFFNNHKNRKDKNFQYLCAPERHEDGAIHFHGFISWTSGLVQPDTIPKRIDNKVVQVPNTPGYYDWSEFSSRFGFFNGQIINDKEEYAKKISYVANYISKAYSDNYFKDSQLVLHSQNMNKPEKVYFNPEGNLLIRPDYEDEFCAVAWADEHDTAPLYKHWSYVTEDEIYQTPAYNLYDYWQCPTGEQLNTKDVIQSNTLPSVPAE